MEHKTAIVPSLLTAILLLLLLLLPRLSLALEIKEITLEGGSANYLEVGAKVEYVLTCNYRTPYDDPVKEVMWKKDKRPFYKWTSTGQSSVLDMNYLGAINSSPSSGPQNIHFKSSMPYSLVGEYACLVFTENATANASYNLQLIDAESGPYNVTVEVLSKILQDKNKYDVNKAEPDQKDSATTHTEVSFEDKDCTLVWSFSSPAIYPKPNVTCGHYSFDQDDVVTHIPGGLTLHKFPNGSWSASFKDTYIEVSSIPRTKRLGCSIRIPNTTFKKVVRAQDNIRAESLIDTGGCPGLDHVMEGGVLVSITGASHTCRGDYLPADRSGRALATLRCPYKHQAIFSDGNPNDHWQGGVTLSCSENDVGWRYHDPENPDAMGTAADISTMPMCVPVRSGGDPLEGKVSILSLSLIVLWSLQRKVVN